MAEIKYLDLENLNDEDRAVLDELIRDWTTCNQVCDLATPKLDKRRGLDKVDEYMRTLPGADYVLTQTLNYVFSNGLTTGSIVDDVKLDEFLYRKNAEGTTNLHVLRDSIGMAITHGACGLRWLRGNIYQYKWGCYRILTLLKDGIQTVVGFIVAKDGKKVPPIKFHFDEYKEYEDFLKEIDKNELILLDTKEFMVIRNDTSLFYGHSPLLRDEARLDLLTAVYERLNYDIRYDGPGRIIIRPKDGFVSGDANDISTTAVISEALSSQKKQKDEMLKEARRVANQIKGSASDSVIVLSNAFSDKIERLERVTKATEFFTWIKNDTLLLAQDFGMSPSLLELGNVSGNVSMTSIIDLAMLNSIVPLRERYATQFSSFLSDHLGVKKIFFNLYEMAQQEDVNTMRTKVVNMMSLLNAMKYTEGDGENAVEKIQPKALQLFKDLADMLSANIHNEVNQLEELKVAKRHEEVPILNMPNK